MKPRIGKTYVAAITAAALAASAGAASAAGIHMHSASSTMSKTSMQATPKDNLTLSPSQQRTAWRDLSKQASNATAPSDFKASVGATVPNDVTIKAVPAKVAARVKSLKPYDFALLNNKLVIVNPNDKKVVDVITQHA